jgi:hypothetical protein
VKTLFLWCLFTFPTSTAVQNMHAQLQVLLQFCFWQLINIQCSWSFSFVQSWVLTLGNSELTFFPALWFKSIFGTFLGLILPSLPVKCSHPYLFIQKTLTKAAAIGLTFLNHPIKKLTDYTRPRRLFPSTDILL